MVRKLLNLKEKIRRLLQLHSPLCLGNISKDFTVYYKKKTGLNGYVYDFSVDYDAMAVDNILDIHKHLMKK